MAEILPFEGVFFNLKKAGNISSLIAPPYDVIKERSNFLSPYNITKLTLSWEENDYKQRGELFRKWLKEEILTVDSSPAFYLHYHYFTLEGKKFLRKGFFALVKLYPFEEKVILPHEKTLASPKEDRFKLLKEVKTSLEPVFFLLPDGLKVVKHLENARKEKIFEFEKGDETHLLFAVREEEIIDQIVREVDQKKLYIADGHHRYETSLLYSKENPSFTHILGYLVAMEDEGLKILPAHRLIKSVPKTALLRLFEEGKKLFHFFHLDQEDFIKSLEEKGRKHHAFAMVRKGEKPVLIVSINEKKVEEEISDHSPAWKKLDISILHSVILEEIMGLKEEELQSEGLLKYIVDRGEALRLIEKGDFVMGFFLNPTRIEEVKKVADRGEKMPGKATYFYPKVPSGLVIQKP